MGRSQLGLRLVVSGVLACGEASGPTHPDGAGTAGRGGSSGPSTGGGSSATSGAGETPASGAGGAAAGSGSENAPYFQPGTRLKAKVFALDDDVDVLRDVAQDASWYDSELEHDCLFLPDEAGVERCFPRQFLTGRAYSDPDCTQRVLADSAAGTCAAARFPYVVLNQGGSCGNRGFRVGKQLPESAPLYYSADGSSCQPSAQSSAVPIYEVQEVPPETFVGMRRRPRARAEGLDAYVREGDDGSWQILGYFDAARDAPCFDTFIGFDPPSKCVPAYSNALWFADASCRTRVGSDAQAACKVEPPTVLIDARLEVEHCPVTRAFDLYEISDVRETEYHQLDDSGACTASTMPMGKGYVQGAAIDASTLPTLESLVVGEGAVRALFSGFGGVPYVPISYAHTGLLVASGEACQSFRFGDGSLRCVPASFATSLDSALMYEDASCEEAPVAPWVAKPTCPLDPPLPGAIVFVDPAQCELGAREVRVVLGESTVRPLYAKDTATGSCLATAVSPASTYLRVGEVLADAELPELNPTTRE